MVFLSRSLFLYVILNTLCMCVCMWCLSGWFVCLIDREREGERERAPLWLQRLAIRRKWRRTYCFIVDRFYYTYITGRIVPMNKYVWSKRNREREREKKPNISNQMVSNCDYWCMCIYTYVRMYMYLSNWNDTCIYIYT